MTAEINHPYMNTLLSTLEQHYSLHERLNRRLVLIKENYSIKTEHEKNEIEISIIDTRIRIDALKKVIEAREAYFKKYIHEFSTNLKDLEANYETILAKAKNSTKKVIGLEQMLDAIDWKAVEENIEVKLKLYERLKTMVK